MKKVFVVALTLILTIAFGTIAFAAVINGAADNERDDLGYYYALTGGLFPNGQTVNGDNASGGTLRFLTDDPNWGGYALGQWNRDDWFTQNSGLALTMKYKGGIVYDNNLIEEGDPNGFYNEATNANLAGLYGGYCMSNNYDWVYAGYFKVSETLVIDQIIGYFDARSGFDPDNPEIGFRMNIWSAYWDDKYPMPTVASFTGDVLSSDNTDGTFSWSDTDVDRIYSGFPDGKDDIWRIVFTLDQPIKLEPGDYFFGHDAYVKTVPVPAAVWLLGSGLVGLAGLRRKFRA